MSVAIKITIHYLRPVCQRKYGTPPLRQSPKPKSKEDASQTPQYRRQVLSKANRRQSEKQKNNIDVKKTR
jgi:hypothetical protein